MEIRITPLITSTTAGAELAPRANAQLDATVFETMVGYPARAVTADKAAIVSCGEANLEPFRVGCGSDQTRLPMETPDTSRCEPDENSADIRPSANKDDAGSELLLNHLPIWGEPGPIMGVMRFIPPLTEQVPVIELHPFGAGCAADQVGVSIEMPDIECCEPAGNSGCISQLAKEEVAESEVLTSPQPTWNEPAPILKITHFGPPLIEQTGAVDEANARGIDMSAQHIDFTKEGPVDAVAPTHVPAVPANKGATRQTVGGYPIKPRDWQAGHSAGSLGVTTTTIGTRALRISGAGPSSVTTSADLPAPSDVSAPALSVNSALMRQANATQASMPTDFSQSQVPCLAATNDATPTSQTIPSSGADMAGGTERDPGTIAQMVDGKPSPAFQDPSQQTRPGIRTTSEQPSDSAQDLTFRADPKTASLAAYHPPPGDAHSALPGDKRSTAEVLPRQMRTNSPNTGEPQSGRTESANQSFRTDDRDLLERETIFRASSPSLGQPAKAVEVATAAPFKGGPAQSTISPESDVGLDTNQQLAVAPSSTRADRSDVSPSRYSTTLGTASVAARAPFRATEDPLEVSIRDSDAGTDGMSLLKQLHAADGLVPTSAPHGSLNHASIAPMRQVADAIIRSGPAANETEVTLAPEELGKVQFSIRNVDGQLSIVILADRPETMALLRRHADLLTAELAQSGMDGATLDFGGGGQADDQPSRTPRHHMLAQGPAKDMPIGQPQHGPDLNSSRIMATGRVDIRL